MNAIPPDEHGQALELSPQQQRIWMAQELYPDARMHEIVWAFSLPGRIDRERFQCAFQMLVDSSDALRTVFEAHQGVPRQRVLPMVRRPVDYVNLSTEPDPQAAADAWVRMRAALGFKLSQCLYDTALIETGETRFLWFLHVHHGVFDGSSVALIAQLLAGFYDRAGVNGLPERIELPLFQDHLRAERESARFLGSQETAAFWRTILAARMDALSFYGWAPRHGTTQIRRLSRKLSAAQMQRLEALARQRESFPARIAMFGIFASALSTLLLRISGSRCFCLGTPFHNRRTAASRNTLGLLMQAVPLPIRIEASDTFLSLMQRIERQATDCFLHVRHGFPASLQESPFDVILNFHVPLNASLGGVPIKSSWLHPGHQLESLGLDISQAPEAEGLTLDFNLNGEVFPAPWGELLADQFFRVLDVVLEEPNRSIDAIDLLSGEERRRLLVELNSGWQPSVSPLTFPALFEAQARRTPDATAAECGNESISYGALNRRANQLARHLQQCGVGPESVVGVYMEPSIELAVAFLGVQKAGGALLPLEPGYPRERTEFMLRDAGAQVVITRAGLVSDISALGLRTLCMDQDRLVIGGQSEDDPVTDLMPGNLAYVIYTSGSTGAPKGVMLTQASFCNRLLWGASTFLIDGEACYLQNASLAYDAALWALMEPWVAGGRTVIALREGRGDPSYLGRLISSAKVTFLAVTPTMLHALLDVGALRDCASLRHVFAWGERLAPDLAGEFFRQSTAELYNVYGQTETCISALHWRCRAGEPMRTIPVGHPHANAQVYILDSDLRPVAVGVPGELYIGGAGVARGYLGRPELTAKHFLPNPFCGGTAASASDGDARLFKTGDFARFTPDGWIECLGRVDRQVKIAGNRIELGEVEAVLARHPEIRQCAVVARPAESRGPGPPASSRLVAYYVSAAPVRAEALRRHCRKSLPAFMVPVAYLRLDALPVTRTGKIDERSLPPPAPTDVDRQNAVFEPKDLIEELVALCWAETLGRQQISVDENFYDAGGDSLGGLELLARLQENFQVEVPLRQLVEGPTIAEMAAWIRQAREAGIDPIAEPGPVLIGIRRGGSRPPFFFVPGGSGGERTLLPYARLARHLQRDQPLYGFLMQQIVSRNPAASTAEVARVLLKDVKRIQPAGPYLLGGECHGGIVALEMAQQLCASGEEVSLLFLFDTASPYGFGPSNEKFRLLRLAMGHPRRLYRRMRSAIKARQHSYLRMVANYCPVPYSGSLDLLVNEQWERKSAALDWDPGVVGSFRLHVMPGDHFSYFGDQVRTTATILQSRLDQAQGARDGSPPNKAR